MKPIQGPPYPSWDDPPDERREVRLTGWLALAFDSAVMILVGCLFFAVSYFLSLVLR